MSDETNEHEPKVKEALKKVTIKIIEELRERNKAIGIKCHLDFLYGAATALHAVDVELWNGDKDDMRTCPPVFFFSWRYKNTEEFLADWDKHHNPETNNERKR